MRSGDGAGRRGNQSTFLEGRRALQEPPGRQLGGLVRAVGAVRVEGLLHLDVDDEAHLEGLDVEVLVDDIQLQLARQQGAGARGGLAVEDERRGLDLDGQGRRGGGVGMALMVSLEGAR